MSDTLQEKLQAIADTKEHAYQCAAQAEGQDCCIEKPEIVTQILQAVQDAGYAPYNSVHQYKRDGMVQLCMTGEEFYNRFKTEIEKQSLFDLTADEFTQSHKEYLQAAKRAAGLTEKEGA